MTRDAKRQSSAWQLSVMNRQSLGSHVVDELERYGHFTGIAAKGYLKLYYTTEAVFIKKQP
jgi:hypothetical protein